MHNWWIINYFQLFDVNVLWDEEREKNIIFIKICASPSFKTEYEIYYYKKFPSFPRSYLEYSDLQVYPAFPSYILNEYKLLNKKIFYIIYYISYISDNPYGFFSLYPPTKEM